MLRPRNSSDPLDEAVVVLLCDSCGSTDDLVVPIDDDDTAVPIYCRECRSPLTSLDFPEDYCDLGEAD